MHIAYYIGMNCFQQIGIYGTFLDLKEVQNTIEKWKNKNLLNLSEVR